MKQAQKVYLYYFLYSEVLKVLSHQLGNRKHALYKLEKCKPHFVSFQMIWCYTQTKIFIKKFIGFMSKHKMLHGSILFSLLVALIKIP